MKLPIADTQWNFLPPGVSLFDFEGIEMMPLFFVYLFIVWSIVWLIGMILFICRINETQVQMRSPTLVILSSIGAELALLCTTLDIYLTHEYYPCFLDLWYILSFFPLYFIPFVLRFIRYFITMKKLSDWQHNPQNDPRSSIWIKESTWVTILGYILGITMSSAVLIQYTICSEWVSAYGCQLTDVTFYVLVTIFTFCFLIVSAGLVIMRKIPDPYNIKSELVTCFTLWIFTLGPYILLYKFMPNERNNLTFLMYFFIVGGYFTSVLWPIYLSYMHPPEQTTPDKILDTVEQITLDPDGYKLVEQIALEHHASEMPPLFREILMFRDLTDATEMKNRAIYIYNQFIRPGAPKQNNFSHTMVTEIEARLNEATSDIFNGPYREILKLLKTNFLREVKNLPAFSELVKKREDEEHQRRMQKEVFQGKK